jgi:hypothetical protein
MGRPQLIHSRDQQADQVCLALSGELDPALADQLDAALAEAICCDRRG